MQGRQRNYLALFLSYFKTLGIGPDPGIELLIYSIIIIIINLSLFIHEIVSFYMVFLGIVFKTRLIYSKELFHAFKLSTDYGRLR